MVIFKQNLDHNKKIYIPKVMREAGFSKTINIIPNNYVAIMYPFKVNLETVEKSIRIILQDIKQRLANKDGK